MYHNVEDVGLPMMCADDVYENFLFHVLVSLIQCDTLYYPHQNYNVIQSKEYFVFHVRNTKMTYETTSFAPFFHRITM